MTDVRRQRTEDNGEVNHGGTRNSTEDFFVFGSKSVKLREKSVVKNKNAKNTRVKRS